MNHNEDHLTADSRRALKLALVITASMILAEAIGGFIANSLALVSDAGHMLVDSLSLGLSLFALSIATRPATNTKTYGYHRVEIMVALVNGVALVLTSAAIFYDAYVRFRNPPPIRTPLMLAIASLGLLANLAGILLLRKSRQDNLNIKSAFWHVAGDTISSVGVIAGGIVISFTGWYIVDPILATLIGVIILWGAVRLVRESTNILMEAVPEHIKMENVVRIIKGVAGVKDIHDLHIWTITSGIFALSVHILIDDQMVSRGADIVDAVNRELASNFNINHTTVQIECERCESCPTGLVCTMQRATEQVPVKPSGNSIPH